jgi:hypothetical protein
MKFCLYFLCFCLVQIKFGIGEVHKHIYSDSEFLKVSTVKAVPYLGVYTTFNLYFFTFVVQFG